MDTGVLWGRLVPGRNQELPYSPVERGGEINPDSGICTSSNSSPSKPKPLVWLISLPNDHWMCRRTFSDHRNMLASYRREWTDCAKMHSRIFTPRSLYSSRHQSNPRYGKDTLKKENGSSTSRHQQETNSWIDCSSLTVSNTEY